MVQRRPGFRLRPELLDVYPLIFQYLSSSQETISSLTLTCSIFRWIAQPLLFRRLHIRPFQVLVTPHRRIASFPYDKVQRQLERLRFCTLPRIAPAVQRCDVVAPENHSFHYLVCMNGNVNVILDALLASLPAFVNLRDVEFVGVNLTSTQFRRLNHIRTLRALHLHACHAPIGGPLYPLLRVDHLLINCHLGIVSRDAWLRTTQVDKIISLKLFPSDDADRFLYSPLMDSMVCLQDLDIRITLASSHQLLSVLSKLPALRHLKLFFHSFIGILPHTEHLEYDDLQTTLAALESYNGPLITLVHLRLPRLRLLTIKGLSETHASEPNTVLAALAHLQDIIHNLDFLALTVVYLTDSLARMLFSLLSPQSALSTFRLFVANYPPYGTPIENDGLQVWLPDSILLYDSNSCFMQRHFATPRHTTTFHHACK
jgi:hypothetical protein